MFLKGTTLLIMQSQVLPRMKVATDKYAGDILIKLSKLKKTLLG